uniref:ATP synthase protein MI25 n=1 Tax=Botryococcus braunii TaxID=38881 RepID=A0A0U2EZW1_BOTBR|nr:ATP synthase F0 subunit beta [Botryococcus braunii]AKU37089.1 ATP synthase F0 subunit beta [Botryococcus braunii]
MATYTNQRWRMYLILFLIFCVLSSTHILIYNEELLVVITFFFFLSFLSQYFGNTIKESLDERSDTIGTELQNLFLLRRDSLQELSEEYERALELPFGMKGLNHFTKQELKRGVQSTQKALRSTLSHQMGQKVTTLLGSATTGESELQIQIGRNQLGIILYHLENLWRGKKIPSWDRKRVERGIKSLKEIRS